MTDMPTMRAAFRTTVSGDSKYEMVFRFPSIEAMHAADDEWHASLSQPPEASEPKPWYETDAHRDLSRIIPDMEGKVAEAKIRFGHCLPANLFAPLEASITELRVLRHELAAIPAPEASEVEAVVTIGKDWRLLWSSQDTLSTIVERTGIKIGDKLYAHPPKASPMQDDKYRLRLLELLAVIHRDGGQKTQEIGIRLAYEQALQLSSERIAATPPKVEASALREIVALALVNEKRRFRERSGDYIKLTSLSSLADHRKRDELRCADAVLAALAQPAPEQGEV